jgi:hypothetical protein
MKTKKLAYVGFLMFFASHILFAGDYKKEITVEDAMKAFCGTWITDSGAKCQKSIWYQNGTYEWYCFGITNKPKFKGTFKIEKAWMDREANIWCIVWRSFRGNSWTLTKINADRNVQEYMRTQIRDELPTEIDPDDPRYRKDIREKME